MLSKVERLRLRIKQREAEIIEWRTWAADLIGRDDMDDPTCRKAIAVVWAALREATDSDE